MSALGLQLFFIVVVAMFWPESFGRWLRRVKDGFGPINIRQDTYIHTTKEEPKP
jgi:hypothetical protein